MLGANELFAQGRISAQQYQTLIGQIKLEYSDWGRIGDTLRASLEDNFTAILMNARSFGDAMKSILMAVLQEIIRVMIVQKIVGFVVGAMAGSPAATAASTAGTVGAGMNTMGTIPAMANGGPVQANHLYMVNERGQEFFLPSTSGNIINNEKLQRAIGDTKKREGVIVNQTINVSTGVQQTVRAEMMGMMPMIKAQTKTAVMEEVSRGGSYSRAMKK